MPDHEIFSYPAIGYDDKNIDEKECPINHHFSDFAVKSGLYPLTQRTRCLSKYYSMSA
jgi:hypothetical protein